MADVNLHAQVARAVQHLPTDPQQLLAVVTRVLQQSFTSSIRDLELELAQSHQESSDRQSRIEALEAQLNSYRFEVERNEERTQQITQENKTLLEKNDSLVGTVRSLRADLQRLKGSLASHLREATELINNDTPRQQDRPAMRSAALSPSNFSAAVASPSHTASQRKPPLSSPQASQHHNRHTSSFQPVASSLSLSSSPKKLQYDVQTAQTDDLIREIDASMKFSSQPSYVTPPAHQTPAEASNHGLYSATAGHRSTLHHSQQSQNRHHHQSSAMTDPGPMHKSDLFESRRGGLSPSNANASNPASHNNGTQSPSAAIEDSARDLFRQARIRLSFEDFQAFLNIVKRHHSSTSAQSFQHTIDEAQRLLQVKHQDLLQALEQLLTHTTRPLR